jgi:formylglycine-generating enzyme required for sulfatase activity
MKINLLHASVIMCSILFVVACDSDSGDAPTTPVTISDRDGSMVLIRAKEQSFQMGSATGNAEEQPAHTVTFTYDFYMDTTEVTQSAYHLLMTSAYPSYSAPFWGAPFGVGDRHPVYSVEWEDAALYCNARSKQAGLDTVYAYTSILGTPGNGCKFEGLTMHPDRSGYRLPTEAEWEFACRAGGTTDFFWAKDFQPYPSLPADTLEVSSYAIWAVNSWNLSSDNNAFGTQPIAERLPNAYGLYDIAGNVTEWCHDWYDASWYAQSSAIDPVGPATGDWHALRGGNWGSEAIHLRSSNREFAAPDYLFYFIGFRTVRPVR